LYNVERKSKILDLLEKQNTVSVNNLAHYFRISKETIRRDLKQLEEAGLIKRSHGGAVSVQDKIKNYEYPLVIRSMHNHEEKMAICKKAAEFIDDGDTIFIDNSSTCMNIIPHIINKKVVIVTNSIQLLLEYSKYPNNNLSMICLGGVFQGNNFSLYGPLSQVNADTFYPNKAFFSCRGLSLESGFTEAGIYEAEVKRLFIKHSKTLFFLIDSSKFGNPSSIHLTDISTADYIITDSKISREYVDTFYSSKIKLVIADL
jgi:DeoR family transcriptional regulator, fructose operon transcriptional repressor